MEQTTQKNKMGTTHMPKLMLKMGIPMIISMVLQALYNIVDSAFVSNMKVNGEEALNALTLAFPAQVLMIAVSIGTGVGAGAVLSKSLGQGNREKVNKIAGNAIFLGGVIFVLFLLFGFFGVNIYIGVQTKSELIADMAKEYLKICCVISFGIIFFSVFEKLLQSTGRSMFSTIAQIAGAVTNIILDPIMIYGLIGCPEMGIAGAAYATVIGQIVSLALAMIFHFTVNKEVRCRLRDLKPSGRLIGEIYAIGLPAIIAQALMSFMTFGMNLILGMIDDAFVTAYGLYYKIQQFVLFAAFGLRDAITPIVSYNYGMRDVSRVKSGVKFGMIYTTAIMVLGLLVLEIFANPLSSVFGLSGYTQKLCIDAMRIISISFIFAGANIAFQGIFQALESGGSSLIISVCRQLLFVLPPAWGFAAIIRGGAADWLVWLSFIIAEGLSLVIALFLMKRTYKKKIVPLTLTAE